MWFFVFGIVAGISLLIAKKSQPAQAPLPAHQPLAVAGNALPEAPPSAIELLTHCLRNHAPFPPDLPLHAMAEARHLGDWETLAALQQAFIPQPTPQPDPKPSQTQIVGSALPPSPVRGVDTVDWSRFVDKLSTQPVDYRDDKHVGKYHHHTKRLAELGIDPTTLCDDSSQYKALETDITHLLTSQARLINEFAGDAICVQGQTVPVTRSGILAILKCAGPDGARSWLSDESERSKYPQTTKMFLSTNQIF